MQILLRLQEAVRQRQQQQQEGAEERQQEPQSESLVERLTHEAALLPSRSDARRLPVFMRLAP